MATSLNSPGIVTKEIDLTGVVPANTSSIGAIVGNYRWGPVETRQLISDEKGLASTFGIPTLTNSVDFHTAAYFLRYTSNLYTTRMVTDEAVNAVSGTTATLIKNADHYDSVSSGFGEDSEETDTGLWAAKYPGVLGNSLKVSICPAISNADEWAYISYFDGVPGTSDYAASRGGENDEMHVIVIDEDGLFTGTRGTVLEKFAYVSQASDAKTNDGSTNYVKNVINNGSRFVWFGSFSITTNFATSQDGGSPAAGIDFTDGIAVVFDSDGTATSTDFSLDGGVDSETLTTSEYLLGYDLYEDKDVVTVDFLIAPSPAGSTAHNTIVNDLIATAQGLRKDCVVVASPNRESVVNNTDIVTDTVSCFDGVTKSSYLIKDNNFLKVYDKYNDQYIFIPASSSTAGIMAATDANAAPFYSPAGVKRGQYLGITSIAYSATTSERDTLYKVGINSIANIPGQGIILYGDKTGESRPSAFDRINVRRLFLMIERAITIASRNVMFEFNDEFTRAEFTNIVEPYLRNIKGRRGIYDFRVVCDETNNTGDVIDNNEFIADIFIKPARSINYVTLNFVAVRSGASFEEIVGTV